MIEQMPRVCMIDGKKRVCLHRLAGDLQGDWDPVDLQAPSRDGETWGRYEDDDYISRNFDLGRRVGRDSPTSRMR